MGGGPVVQRWPCGAVGPRAGQEEEEAEELHMYRGDTAPPTILQKRRVGVGGG